MAQSAARPKTSVPDLSKLELWSKSDWNSFAKCLRRIGLNEANLEPLADVAPNQLPRLAAPLHRWFLNKEGKPFGHAARLLLYKDSITREQAVKAFGEALFAKMLAAGLVVQDSDGLLSTPFHMTIIGDKYIVADDLRNGADAVMGSGSTTTGLIQAVYPKRRLKRALDLGCGAGAIAIVLAARVESVIATDINPRALVFGRINAAINGVENVEFRLGDLFAPVAGEEFDLIVSQPPFIPMPEGSVTTTYLFGGKRGDELPMRVLAGASAHIRNGGRAVILIQWPEIEGDSIPERVRHAVSSPDTDLLLIVYPPINLEFFAIAYSSYDLPELGKEYERLVAHWRNHYENLRMRSMRHCFNVLRKRKDHAAWTKAVYPATGTVTPAGIHQLLRRCDLLAEGDEAMLGATLRVPRGAFATEKRALDQREGTEIRVDFSLRTMGRPVAANREMIALLQTVHKSKTVTQALRKYAANAGWNQQTAGIDFLPEIKNALELGLLEVTNHRRPSRKK